VLYFAVFREKLGRDSDVISLPEPARVRDAIAVLAARHDAIDQLRGKFRVAVNQDFTGDDHALAHGDELALLPPVAGGVDEPAPSAGRHVQLLATPLSLDRCVAAVGSAGMGGIVTFIGMVRRHSRGVVVDRDEIEAELPGTRLAVEHRVGRLEIGDIAVAIAAAAPHRAEAFTACRAMIDRLKQRVPIWKKEVSDDGDEWVGLGP